MLIDIDADHSPESVRSSTYSLRMDRRRTRGQPTDGSQELNPRPVHHPGIPKSNLQEDLSALGSASRRVTVRDAEQEPRCRSPASSTRSIESRKKKRVGWKPSLVTPSPSTSAATAASSSSPRRRIECVRGTFKAAVRKTTLKAIEATRTPSTSGATTNQVSRASSYVESVIKNQVSWASPYVKSRVKSKSSGRRSTSGAGIKSAQVRQQVFGHSVVLSSWV